jgi:hypothetical protein
LRNRSLKKKSPISILDKVFEGHPKNFNVRFWDGRLIEWTPRPKFTIIFNDKRTFKKLFLRGDILSAGKSYITRKLDIDGNIFEALKLGDYFASLKLSRIEKFRLLLELLAL